MKAGHRSADSQFVPYFLLGLAGLGILYLFSAVLPSLVLPWAILLLWVAPVLVGMKMGERRDAVAPAVLATIFLGWLGVAIVALLPDARPNHRWRSPASSRGTSGSRRRRTARR